MNKLLLTLFLTLTLGMTLTASDVILSHTLGAYYCAQEPNPKTYIKHTVEEPISIYWEDNVYPGFDEADSKLMVANYLDGVHLQTMALNTPDGKVKVYQYKELPQSYVDLVKEGYVVFKDWQEKDKIHQEAFKRMYDESSHEIRKEFVNEWNIISTQSGNAYRKKDDISKQIETAKAQLTLVISETTKEQMPMMNYTVKTNEVHLSDLAQKVLYSDEMSITDNRTKEVIAYARRIMQLYSASLLPDEVGGRYYYPHPLCGGTYIDLGVFNTLERGPVRSVDINKMLYKKYSK